MSAQGDRPLKGSASLLLADVAPRLAAWLDHRFACQQCREALEIYGVKKLGDPELTPADNALLERHLCDVGREARRLSKKEHYL